MLVDSLLRVHAASDGEPKVAHDRRIAEVGWTCCLNRAPCWNTDRMYDAIIVGGGPAGLSAALILGRALRTVLVVDDAQPRNAPADESHGFITRDGARPAELLQHARSDVSQYPSIAFSNDTAVAAAKCDGAFTVQLRSGATVSGKKLLLATGVFDQLPDIAGLRERWGKSIFVCPFCDGWEIRAQRVAVYGSGRDAVELAQELHGWTNELLVCAERDDLTDRDRRWIANSGATLTIGRLTAIAGRPPAQALTFEDGSVDDCGALFLSAPLRQHSKLFADLGCDVGKDGSIVADAHYHTTVDGCFAAGDSVTHRHQVIIAAASGVAAAISLNCNLLDAEADAVIAGHTPAGR